MCAYSSYFYWFWRPISTHAAHFHFNQTYFFCIQHTERNYHSFIFFVAYADAHFYSTIPFSEIQKISSVWARVKWYGQKLSIIFDFIPSFLCLLPFAATVWLWLCVQAQNVRCCFIVHRTVKLVIFMNRKQFSCDSWWAFYFHDNIIYNK